MNINYAKQVIKWRWIIVAVTLAITALAIMGAKRTTFQSDYRIYFDKEDPYLVAFEKQQKVYTKNDSLQFVLKPENGDITSPGFLEVVKGITDESWKLPFSIRVDSITNFQHTLADGDELIVRDLVSDPASLNAAGRDQVKEVALAEPALRDRLLSGDAKTTAVNVTFQMPDDSQEARDAFVAAAAGARNIVDQVRQENPDIRVALTGIVMQNRAFEESSKADSKLLYPLMYLAMIFIAAITLRSVSGVFAVIFMMFCASVTAIGIWGWLGMPLNTASAIAPIIILAVAVADCVHVLSVALTDMRAGSSKTDAIIHSLRMNYRPVLLTSLTTCAGYLALNFAESPPVSDLGNLTAIGVMAGWLYSTVSLPALMAVLPFRPRPKAERTVTIFDNLAGSVIRRRVQVGVAVLAIGFALAFMIPGLELDDQFVEYFDHSIPFRVDTDFAADNLAGPYTIQFSLGAGEDGGVSDPAYLQRLEAFTGWLREQSDVVHVSSFSDIMKRLNRNMHGDDPAYYRLPEERNLAAQYLLLYEMSLPYGLDLTNQVDINRSASRVLVTMDDLTTMQQRDLISRSEGWLAKNTPEYMHARAVGTTVMFAFISERNISSMITGNMLAILLITLTIMLSIKSLRLGLVSLLVNCLPIAMTLGLWSVLIGRIGMSSAILTATALGIIVDDTIHFLSKYNWGRRERGYTAEEAIRFTYHTVGRPMVITSVMLIAGFGIVAMSSFLVNSHLGLMMCLTVFFALVTDMFLLPAILLAIDSGKELDTEDQKISITEEVPHAL